MLLALPAITVALCFPSSDMFCQEQKRLSSITERVWRMADVSVMVFLVRHLLEENFSRIIQRKMSRSETWKVAKGNSGMSQGALDILSSRQARRGTRNRGRRNENRRRWFPRDIQDNVVVLSCRRAQGERKERCDY